MQSSVVVRAPLLIAALFVGGVVLSVGEMQQNSVPANAAGVSRAVTSANRSDAVDFLHSAGFEPHAKKYNQLIWGVDAMGVKSVKSGEMIRFSYTVTDPAKAKPLNDRKSDPVLLCERARASLVVPSL